MASDLALASFSACVHLEIASVTSFCGPEDGCDKSLQSCFRVLSVDVRLVLASFRLPISLLLLMASTVACSCCRSSRDGIVLFAGGVVIPAIVF